MRLSVICPTYNRAPFLLDCVTPLMDLPVGAVEVIVVDDCSSDNTREVCTQLERKYGTDRVRYYRLKKNEGAPVARNRGISEARGDCIMFLDSDDQPFPEGIAELLAVLQASPSLDFVYGSVIVTDDALVALPHCPPIGSPYVDTCAEIGGYHWHTMGAIYRRACIQRVGLWNSSLTGSQDWEYQARVKIAGAKGVFVDAIVGYWRQHEGARVGATAFRPDYVRSVMAACKSILTTASLARRRDSRLELRIAKRLFVHALEWGANGFDLERHACLIQAAGCFTTFSLYQLFLYIYALVPPLPDRSVRAFIVSLR
ncbi:glycosyltransferase family 2 protein [Cyanobium sp. ATX 6A2]|uniref:glycosyltransferase family 2 protein n=1 Tax=Cyanobium sp. ATX 6A2 TaxID=2823700 RepID=UPI0020CFE57A|nr:glycosyltransferase family 2 protein [Cyanobium sp. ATX 6A2]MCP9888700.1 glycosyltransferase family 2 protein [Cyanobium sp. ATX 6A2]